MKKNQLQYLWRALLCGVTFAALCVASPTLSAYDGDDDDDDDDDEIEEVAEENSWETRRAEMLEFQNGLISKCREELTNEFNYERVVQLIENLTFRRYRELATDMCRARDGKGGFTAVPRAEAAKSNSPNYTPGAEALGDFALLRVPGTSVDWKKWLNARRPAPPKSLKDIVDDIGEQAEEIANEKVQPEAQKRAIREQAEERFRMVQHNERVTLTLRGGRGASALIDNQPFRAVTDEYVQLGNRTIIREDLDPEDQAKFYTDVNEELKESYITNRIGQVDVEVESRISAYIFENTAEQFLLNYYVPDITKPTASLRTAKPEFWVSMKSFVDKVQKVFIERRMIEFEAQELPVLMKAKGYVLVDKEDGSGQEWVDQEEKERREQPQQQQNLNDMDPMMMGMPGGPGMGMPGGMPRH